MKVYKVELMIIDYEDIGGDEISLLLSQNRYINPYILNIESQDCGEWNDNHPLNNNKTVKAEMQRLFGK